MPEVSPEVLKWARETAGLSKAEAASKLDLRPAYGLTAEERLAAIESGDVEPTRPQLVKMAAEKVNFTKSEKNALEHLFKNLLEAGFEFPSSGT